MAIDWEKLGPDTPISELSVGDLLEVIGWALTNYKAGESGDVQGFTFQGFRPAIPALSSQWKNWQPTHWAKVSGARTTGGQTLR
jgi:hypothetical protein